MSNKAIAITIAVLLAATGYLLLKSDGDIDMGGEKHGAEATQAHDAKKDAKPEEKK
jgi:hypothetical protein